MIHPEQEEQVDMVLKAAIDNMDTRTVQLNEEVQYDMI